MLARSEIAEKAPPPAEGKQSLCQVHVHVSRTSSAPQRLASLQPSDDAKPKAVEKERGGATDSCSECARRVATTVYALYQGLSTINL